MILVPVVYVALMSSGCTTVHSADAVLFELAPSTGTESGTAEVFQTVRRPRVAGGSAVVHLSGNPITLAKDSVFSIDITEICPGWIHQGEDPGTPSPGSAAWNSTRDSWAKEERDHLRGKELWLVTVIRAVDVEDPLQLKTKTYVRSSNIKYDSESFSLIPLDGDESEIFTHGADSSYRVNFKLYEVDGVDFKRQIAGVARENAGLIEAAEDLLSGLKGAVAGFFGSRAQKLLDKYKSDPVFFERLLLKFGATLELEGSVALVLADPPISKDSSASSVAGLTAATRAGDVKPANGGRTRDYLLVDPIKSRLFDRKPGETLFDDEATYQAMQKALRDCVLKIPSSAEGTASVGLASSGPDSRPDKFSPSLAYLRVRVTETPPPEEQDAADARKALTQLDRLTEGVPPGKESLPAKGDYPELTRLLGPAGFDSLSNPRAMSAARKVLELRSRKNQLD